MRHADRRAPRELWHIACYIDGFHIFELAGRRDALGAAPEEDAASELLTSLLGDIAVLAYIMGRTWDMLGWTSRRWCT